MDYNFDSVDFFSIKAFLSYFKLYFDLDTKAHFYKEEPFYFAHDLAFLFTFVAPSILNVNSKSKSRDIMTAREIIAYRNAQLKNQLSGLDSMSDEQMEYEVKRIEEWGEE